MFAVLKNSSIFFEKRILEFLKLFQAALCFFSLVFISNLSAKYDATEFTLKNGLQVIVVKKNTLPIVACYIGYKCGSLNDAISKSGAAHYLEHMAFEIDHGRFDKFLESKGAERNAMTSFNFVIFYEILAKEHLEEVLKNEAVRMRAIDNIDDSSFASEKGAILEERSMTVDNKPSSLGIENLLANLFNRDVISMIIGWKHEIANLLKQDLVDYHRRWFAPNNAVVVLVGDVDVTNARKLMDKYFSSIPAHEVPKVYEEVNRPEIFKEVVYGSPKNGSLFGVSYVYYVPYLYRKNYRKQIALSMALEILNRSESFLKEMLQSVLRTSHVTFSGEFNVFPFDMVIVSIDSGLNNETENSDLWKYTKYKIINQGISKRELDEEKRSALIARAYKNDDISDIASDIVMNIIQQRTLEEIQSQDDIIQSITVDECNEALKDVFDSKEIAVMKIVPKGYDRDEE